MTARSNLRIAMTAMLAALTFLAACSDSPAVAPESPAVYAISVTIASDTLIIGQQATLRATPRASTGEQLDRPVVWTSEDEDVAKVSAAGVVTAVAVGEAAIRATSDGRFARVVLRIRPKPPTPVAEVRISADTVVTLQWNGSTTITATALDANENVLEGRTVQWLSNRTNIATISPTGRIDAVSPGIATITAIIEGAVSQVGVRVLPAPVTDITIQANSFGLEVGDFMGFAARITRADGSVFYGPTQWTSSAPSIARISHVDILYAVVESVAEGEVTLTATFEGKSASQTVRVWALPTHDLIYSRYNGAASEIFLLGLGEPLTAPVKLNAGNVSREPSPSPDGSQFVFAVTQPQLGGGMQNDLYIVNRNGTNMRWLTRMPGLEDWPRWSPDGTKILFHGVVDDRPNLYTINVDGTGLFNVTASAPQTMTDRREPAWSPDGTRIVFVGAVGSQHKLWIINADGTNLHQLTTDVGFDMTPSWSPDGNSIAFVRWNVAAPVNGDDIMIVPANGGPVTRYAIVGDQRVPAWSPDGKMLAFAGTAAAGVGTHQIYTMRADGTGVRLRTTDPSWLGGGPPVWIKRQ